MGSSGTLKSVMSVMFFSAAAFALVSCDTPTSDTRSEPSAALTATVPEGAHGAIAKLHDQGNPKKSLATDPNQGVRRVAVDVSCPAGQIVTCGAEATQAVAMWLAEHGSEWGEYKGEPVTHLLVNVDPDGAFGGYQLIGAMPSAAALRSADAATILTAFQWNGAGENGEIAVASWCGKPDRLRQTPDFCAAFFEDECYPHKAAPVVRACPRELLQRP